MKRLNLESIIYKEDKYFVAQCLSVDVSSFGDTKKEAIAQLEDALNLYFTENKKPEVQIVSRVEVFNFSIPSSYA